MPRLTRTFLLAPLDLYLGDERADWTIELDRGARAHLVPQNETFHGVNPRTGARVAIVRARSHHVALRMAEGHTHRAQTVADAITALLDFRGEPPLADPLVAVPVPSRWGTGFSSGEREGLVARHEDEWAVWGALGGWGSDYVELSAVEWALQTASAVLASHATGPEGCGLLHALVYLSMSRMEYPLVGDRETWALGSGRDDVPLSVRDRARAEHAYQDAYKAVESMVGGQLPSDRSGVRQRLLSLGVRPSDTLGLEANVAPIEEVLERVRDTRGSRAAHGGRTQAASRAVTYFELLEAQALATFILNRALADR